MNTEQEIRKLRAEVEQLRRTFNKQQLPLAETSLVIPLTEVDSLNDATAGTGTAIAYYIDAANGNTVAPHKDRNGNSVIIPVYNVAGDVGSRGQVYTAHRMPDGKRVLDIGSGERRTWIDFTVTAVDAYLNEVTLRIDAFDGPPPINFNADPDPIPYVVNDEVIASSLPMWQDLCVGCTGRALYIFRGPGSGLYEWIIYYSTRPLNKVLAPLFAELTALTDSGEVADYTKILAQPPFVTEGPEWDGIDAENGLRVANDFKHHGREGMTVELERVYQGIDVEDPEDEEQTISVLWRITRVLDPFPDLIIGTLDSDMPTGLSVPMTVERQFNGLLPSPTVTVYMDETLQDPNVSPFGAFGLKAGEVVVAKYHRDSHKYYIVGSAAAILGGTHELNHVEDVYLEGLDFYKDKQRFFMPGAYDEPIPSVWASGDECTGAT